MRSDRLLAPDPPAGLAPGPVPTFSVVIPAYGVAAYVADAVRSALDQTVAPLDVVVVDDGSPDDVVTPLAPYRDRITLVRQANQGPGAAKLAGARAARGTFVALLDGDDTYLPERLERLGRTAAARPDLDILVTDAHVELDGRRLRRAYDDTWAFEATDQRCGILERCFVLGHAAVRRSALVALESIERETIDDWDCWARLILRGARAGLVDEPLSVYRVRPGSLSTARLSTLRRGVRTLELLRSEPSLTVAELAVLERTRASWNRSFTVESARAALHDGRRADARRLLLAVVRDGENDRSSRVKALASLVAPRLAERLLERRSRSAWTGAAGVRVVASQSLG
jgi:Glycosyl transferase family 2